MRVLICGDRNWKEPTTICIVLQGCLTLAQDSFEDLVVIEGCANGADKAAHDWYNGAMDGTHPIHDLVQHEHYPANWSEHHKAAGPIRNKQMLDAKPDVVFAFHNDLTASKGTMNMVTLARKAGIPVYLIGELP